MKKAGQPTDARHTVLRLLAVLAALGFLAAACSSDDLDAATAGTDASAGDSTGDDGTAGGDDASGDDASGDDDSSDDADSVNFGGDSNSDFCRQAIAYDESRPASSLDFNDPKFFDDSAAALADMVRSAPNEIRDDVDTIRVMTEQFADVIRSADGNVLSPEFADAMDDIDTTEADAAGDRVTQYLEQVCGLEVDDSVDVTIPGLDIGSLEGLSDTEAQAAVFQQMFGVDEELAACLAEELGDFGESAELDPNSATQEICGTTMLELITGISQG